MCSLHTGDTAASQRPRSGAGWLRWPELSSPRGQGLLFPRASVTGRKTSRTPEVPVVPPRAALEGPWRGRRPAHGACVVSGCCLLAAEGNYRAASSRARLRMRLCPRRWRDSGRRASERCRQLLAEPWSPGPGRAAAGRLRRRGRRAWLRWRHFPLAGPAGWWAVLPTLTSCLQPHTSSPGCPRPGGPCPRPRPSCFVLCPQPLCASPYPPRSARLSPAPTSFLPGIFPDCSRRPDSSSPVLLLGWPRYQVE